jgi:hypothetical protein
VSGGSSCPEPSATDPGAWSVGQGNYLRVFFADRAASGPFRLTLRNRACSSITDACMLHNSGYYARNTYLFNRRTDASAPDYGYFRFDPDMADSGQPQTIHLHVTVPGELGRYVTAAVLDSRGRDITSTYTATSPISSPEGLIATAPDVGGDGRYLRIQRHGGVTGQIRLYATWMTNLTILHGGVPPLDFLPDDQGEEFFDEDYRLSLDIDGTRVVDHAYIGERCEDAHVTLDTWLKTHRFLESAVITIHEIDNDEGGDDDTITWRIDPLAPEDFGVTGHPVIAQDDEHYGRYQLMYNLHHVLSG